jgi:hypothetical protein
LLVGYLGYPWNFSFHRSEQLAAVTLDLAFHYTEIKNLTDSELDQRFYFFVKLLVIQKQQKVEEVAK